jgi:hypothetical protein
MSAAVRVTAGRSCYGSGCGTPPFFFDAATLQVGQEAREATKVSLKLINSRAGLTLSGSKLLKGLLPAFFHLPKFSHLGQLEFAQATQLSESRLKLCGLGFERSLQLANGGHKTAVVVGNDLEIANPCDELGKGICPQKDLIGGKGATLVNGAEPSMKNGLTFSKRIAGA